jgi:hypothetical protein
MPKTSVDKNRLPSRSENQIGRSRQSSIVQAISKAQPVNELPNHHFRFGVAISNARHALTSLSLGK